MVLAELGSKLTDALKNVTKEAIIDQAAIDKFLNEVAMALIQSDVNIKLVSSLKNNIKKNLDFEKMPRETNKRNYIRKVMYEQLCKLLNPATEPFKPVKNKTNIIMFVGLQGSGKTTTCTKYAYHYKKQGFNCGLVCCDTFRAGALDQLKQNATKTKIPFYGDYTETDPVKLARDGIEQFKREKFDLIIVDTSGRHRQEEALFDEMEQVSKAINPDDIVFVMDSSIGQAAEDQAKAFKDRVNVGSVIITKLDGHAKGGGALSAVAATKSPITFIGTGEHFDEFESFRTEGFVGRLLGLGDMKSLMEKIQQVVDPSKQPQMIERISKGVFTMRDMYEQLQNIMKMGPLSQVMGMIPGFSEQLLPKGKEKEGQARLKKFLTIMDSMNDYELDNEQFSKMSHSHSRMIRIARGSGASIEGVHELFETHKQFQKAISSFKGLDLANMKDPGNMKQLQQNLMKNMKGQFGKNPAQLQQMQKMMQQMTGGKRNAGGLGGFDPSMLGNMGDMFGGGGGLGDMFKQFGLGG